jgi:hypothetical protein
MRHIAAFIVFSTCLGPSAAQESPQDWAARLSSKSYTEREQAARKLEAIGKPALPLLNQLTTNADLETQRRALAIIERIEQRLTVEELVTPTPVRFRFENLPVEDALREIEKQTGLLCSNGARERISFAAGPLPFWQAWRQFRDAAGLHEADYVDSASKLKPMRGAALAELTQMLTRRDFDIEPRFHARRLEFAKGPPAVAYSSDERHSIRVRVRAIETTMHEKTPHVTVAVELRAEPRLDIVAMPHVEIRKIVAESGKPRTVRATPMLPEAAAQLPSAEFLSLFIGEVQYGGLLHLRMIPAVAGERKWRELHGTVRVEVMVRPRMIEVSNVLAAVGKEKVGRQGVTLKVLEAQKTDEGDVHLRLRLDNLDSLTPKTVEQKMIRVRPGVIAERGPVDFALERLQLLDRAGRPCARTRWSYEPAKTGKGYEVLLLYGVNHGDAEDVSLVLTEEPRKVSVVVPFVVRDVGVPGMMTGK